MKFMDVVAYLAGDRVAGKAEYWFRPKLREPWGSGFNGQAYRQRIFRQVIETHGSDALIETGTFRGSTTAHLLTAGLPVFTGEVNARFHAFAEARLRGSDDLHMYLMDSRVFLKTLIASKHAAWIQRPFCYLDAHWLEDLPLAEEIELILGRWSDAVIMVDDFEVPGTGYDFDDYGGDKVLSLRYLDQLQSLQFATFFPAADESQETGAKRGCVVLANNPATIEKLQAVDVLKSGPGFPRES